CATEDLIGWHEKVDGESVRHEGYLDSFGIARSDAETMIMTARVKAGWITEEDLQADAEGEAEPGEADVEAPAPAEAAAEVEAPAAAEEAKDDAKQPSADA
ncbi:MAG: transcription termination/antitermination protein NusA, partial [Pseudomonadota bacterium]